MFAFITQRESVNQYDEPADVLTRINFEYAASLGFTPLPVPNDVRIAREMAAEIDYRFLYITGGGFVPAEFYVGNLEGATFQHNRDEMERFLIGDALEKGIPILGLCRGSFMLNGIFGGKVLRGGSASKPRHDHYVRFRTGRRVLVNTYHTCAMPRDLLAPNLEEIAVEEGTENVEAFRAKDARVLGLQWHPERPLPSEEAETVSAQLLDWLLNEAVLPDDIRPS